jgi:hypothetical protein
MQPIEQQMGQENEAIDRTIGDEALLADNERQMAEQSMQQQGQMMQAQDMHQMHQQGMMMQGGMMQGQ